MPKIFPTKFDMPEIFQTEFIYEIIITDRIWDAWKIIKFLNLV